MDVDEEVTGERSLVQICQDADLEGARVLLAAGDQRLEQRGADGMTPLLAACLSGSVDLVDLLLSMSADAEALDDGGCGVALLAAESGSVPLLAALLASGRATLAECAEDGSTPLLSAAAGGSAEMIGWLLDGPTGAAAAASLEERDARGADSMLAAAEGGSVEALQELMRRGAATDVTDDHGCGVLHFAAAGGHVAVVEFCVRKLNIPCGVRDSDGDTPLIVAAYEGRVPVVDWLLKNGASLSDRNNDGISAALAAAAGESGEMLEFLAKKSKGGEHLWTDEVSRHPELVLNFLERLAGTGGTDSGGSTMVD